MKERDFIERLERAFPRLRREDDATVHRVRFSEPPGRLDGILTLSTDAAVEGIHFDRRYSTLSQAVQKLVTSNVSDMYAMGGEPEEVLLTAGLREGCTDAEAGEIVEGLRRAADFYHIDLAGGDTVRSGDRFFFNISIIGSQRYGMPVERAGARAGDRLVLFGECGGSLLGMELLRHLSGIEEMGGLPGSVLDSLLALAKRHLVPVARSVESGLLESDPPLLTAMIDVSDGLARDLRNLCRASGVGAVLYEDRLPVGDFLPLFLGDEMGRWTDHVLSSGEEYVMLASCREDPSSGTAIGEILPAGEGLTLVGRNGKRRELPQTGYEHTF
jgi:thiamine-monophosphate kinase